MYLNDVIRQINECLKSFYEESGFYFIDHSLINIDYLWRDGLHLKDAGTKVLSDNISASLKSILQWNKENNA